MSDQSPAPVVLVVEDDDQVRGFITMLLRNEPYQLLEARTGPEGLKAAEQAGAPVDVLLCDMLLPEMSGYDVASAMRAKYPGIRIVLMTGYVEGEIVQRCLADLNATFLDKPFQPAALRQVVRDALAASAPRT